MLPIPLARAWVAGLIALGMLSRKWQFVGPRILNITLPAGCNHDCVFCITEVHGSGAVGSRPVLSFEQISGVIESALSEGTLHVQLTSQGESALYPGIAQLLDRIHRRSRGRAVVQIVTNGTHLEKIGIERILRQRIRLWISLHSSEESTWRKIHRPIGPSRLDELKRNLALITRKKPSLVTIHNVVCNINYEKLDATVNWAIQARIKNLFFGRMYRFPELQLTTEQEQQVARQMISLEPQLKAAGIKNNLASYRLVAVAKPAQPPTVPPPQPVAPALRPSNQYYQSNSCFISWLYSPVSEEGIVSSCGRGRNWGSIKDQTWDQIFSARVRDFRQEGMRISQTGGGIEGCGCSECPHIQMNSIANHLVSRIDKLFSKFK